MNLNSERIIEGSSWKARCELGDSVILFDGIESELAERIGRAKSVRGCIAWFTSSHLLELLPGKEVSIVVQRDKMFYPRGRKAENIANSLKRHYLAIEPRLSEKLGARTQLLDPIRVYGTLPKRSANTAPRMHHKFLILDAEYDSPTVITGSFNLTTTASLSLENVIIVSNKTVVKAYLEEYRAVLRGSKKLHWFGK